MPLFRFEEILLYRRIRSLARIHIGPAFTHVALDGAAPAELAMTLPVPLYRPSVVATPTTHDVTSVDAE